MIKDLNYKNKNTGIEIIIEDYDEDAHIGFCGLVTIKTPHTEDLVLAIDPEDMIHTFYSESDIFQLVNYLSNDYWDENKEKILEACCNAPDDKLIDLLDVAKALLTSKHEFTLEKYNYFLVKETSWDELAESIINDFYPDINDSINKEKFIQKIKNGDTVYINDKKLYKKKGCYWMYKNHIYGHVEDTNESIFK